MSSGEFGELNPAHSSVLNLYLANQFYISSTQLSLLTSSGKSPVRNGRSFESCLLESKNNM